MNFDFSRAAPRTNVQTGGTNAGMEAIRVRTQGQQSLLHGVAQFGNVAERWRREEQQDRFRDRGMEIQAEEQEKRRQASMDLELNKSRLNNLVKSGMLALEQDTSIKDAASFDAAFGKIKEGISRDFRDANKGFRDRQPDLTKGHWDDMDVIALSNFETNAREWFAKKQRADDLAACKIAGENAVADLNPDEVESAYQGLLINGVAPEVAAAQKKEWLGQIVSGKVGQILLQAESAELAALPEYQMRAINEVRAAVADGILSGKQGDKAFVEIEKSFTGRANDYAKAQATYQKDRTDRLKEILKTNISLFESTDAKQSKQAKEDAYSAVEEIYNGDEYRIKAEKKKIDLMFEKAELERKARIAKVEDVYRQEILKTSGEIAKGILSGGSIASAKLAISNAGYTDLLAMMPEEYGAGMFETADGTTTSGQASSENYTAIVSAISGYDAKTDMDGSGFQRLFRDAIAMCNESDAQSALRVLCWKANVGGVKPTTHSYEQAEKAIRSYFGFKKDEKLDGEEAPLAQAIGLLAGYATVIPESQFPSVIESICKPIKQAWDDKENANIVLEMSKELGQRIQGYIYEHKGVTSKKKKTETAFSSVEDAAESNY
jgi:hypothetical protein